MKIKVLFNNITQKSCDVFKNQGILNDLIDKGIYDFGVILFFSYLPDGEPYLCSYILVKLCGDDKYRCYFYRIDDDYEDFDTKMEFIKKDLKERILINDINEFDYEFTKDNLLSSAKHILEDHTSNKM